MRILPPGVSTRAVLFADLVGYSTRMSRDEQGTLEFMVQCSRLVEELAARHDGSLLLTMGDGYLLVFERSIAAVEFGVELHHLISKRQVGRPDRARFRVGIHVGDVHNVNGTIYGHVVNIAARLQIEALPGTCVLSQRAYNEVRSLCDHTFESIGKPPLKNIAEQIALYRIPEDGRASSVRTTLPALVTLIGRVTLRTADAELTFTASSKMSGLFAYIALAEGARHGQEKVASLLWPDHSDSAARKVGGCRRKLSHLLSGDLAAMLVVADRQIGLNELHFDTDLQLIERDLRQGRVPKILVDVPQWPERILEGFEAISPVFSGWLKVTRSAWRARVLSPLSAILDGRAADSEVVRDAARAILAIDPGNEAAAVMLIRHYTLSQNRVAALQEYTRLETYLKVNHGLAPGVLVSEAIRIARAVGTSATVQKRPTRPTAFNRHARLLRISVAHFTGVKESETYIIEGFRSDLISNLARFREWLITDDDVTSRLASTLDHAAAGLVNDYTVDGVWVQSPDGPCLRITLTDNVNRRVVWTDDLNVSVGEWASLQRSVVGRIAAHVETYISADRLHLIVPDNAKDARSHDEWLRAEQIFARWTPEALDEAEGLLQNIIAGDGSFAPAFSSLASLRNVQHVVRPGLPRDAAGARQAHVFAQRAVEIDPLDARNHLALAWTAALTDAFDRAAIHLDLAASLNPNNATTQVSCAMAYAFIGQHDRAQSLVAHVLRISPMLSDYQWCYVASVHFLSGRYEEALSAARLSGDRIVDNPGWMAAALVRLGRTDEARAEFDRLIDAVRPVWAGKGPPIAEAVFDWFTSAYPLRHPADREALRDALSAAMRGQ